MWTLHKQPQHCGAQLPARERKPRRQQVPADAPADAIAGREAQEHDKADLDSGGAMLQPGEYPASSIENRGQQQQLTELEQDESDLAPERGSPNG